jgi:hypothetical protein
MKKSFLLILFSLLIVKGCLAQEVFLKASDTLKYNQHLLALQYNSQDSLSEKHLLELKNQILSKKLPLQYSKVLLQVAIEKFKELKIVIDTACYQFNCNNKTLHIIEKIPPPNSDIELDTMGFVDTSMQSDCFCFGSYSIYVDFSFPNRRQYKLRLFFDAGDLGGTTVILYQEPLGRSLSYYIDDYNTWDQHLLINQHHFYTLHIRQEYMNETDDSSFAKMSRAFIRLPQQKENSRSK